MTKHLLNLAVLLAILATGLAAAASAAFWGANVGPLDWERLASGFYYVPLAQPQPGSISGFVTDAQGNPISGASVAAEPYQWHPDGTWSGAFTLPNGSYTITGLATDSYRVRAEAEGYVREYYDGAREGDSATPVGVVEGQGTADVNFSLDVGGGTISGMVTDAEGQPIPGFAWACADTHKKNYGPPILGECASAQLNGSYTITGLAAGSYRVQATASGYLDEYYNGVRDYADASVVAVVDGRDTQDINFSLAPSVPGDASGDGNVTMVDAMFVAQCVVGLRDCDSINGTMADVNCDGKAGMVDAMLVAQYVVGLIDEFPCTPMPTPTP